MTKWYSEFRTKNVNRVFIFKEKYGERYFLPKTPEEIDKLGEKIFKQRKKWHGESATNPAEYWEILKCRSRNEYEEFEIIKIEKIDD